MLPILVKWEVWRRMKFITAQEEPAQNWEGKPMGKMRRVETSLIDNIIQLKCINLLSINVFDKGESFLSLFL